MDSASTGMMAAVDGLLMVGMMGPEGNWDPQALGIEHEGFTAPVSAWTCNN